MKKLFFSLFIIFVSLHLFAQKKEKIKGNHEVVTKVYTLQDFQAIEAGEDFKIQLKQAVDEEALELRADENLHEVLKWEVNEGVLKIYTTKKIIRRKAFDITIFTDKDLHAIQLHENARMEMEDKLKFKKITIEMDDYAKAELKMMISDTLLVDLKGKSKLEVDMEVPVSFLRLKDGSEIEGVLIGENLVAKGENTCDFNLGGNMNEVEAHMTDKSEFKAIRMTVKNQAVFYLQKRSNASIKGKSAEINMSLSGKSHLHLSGEFNNYNLKKFEGESALTREK